MAANDNAMTRFLFAILQQKCLKDVSDFPLLLDFLLPDLLPDHISNHHLLKIDWNKVARDPILAQEITNGHAARMRYSRFKAAMLGLEPQRRNRTSGSRVSKAKKKDAATKSAAAAKSKDGVKSETTPPPTDAIKHETSPPPPAHNNNTTTTTVSPDESSSSLKIKDEQQQQHFHQRMFMPPDNTASVTAAALHRHPQQQQQQLLSTADHLHYMRLMTPSSDSDILGSQYAASPVVGTQPQTQEATGYEYHHGHHHAGVDAATGEWVSAVGQATAYAGYGGLGMGYEGEWAAPETTFCEGHGLADEFDVGGIKEEQWEYR